jgi:hypothetical protein
VLGGEPTEQDSDDEAAVELASIVANYVDTRTGKLLVKSVSKASRGSLGAQSGWALRLPTPAPMQERIGDGLTAALCTYPEYGTLPRGLPEVDPNAACKCGCLWQQADVRSSSQKRKSIVYSLSWFCEVVVYHRVCKCGEEFHCNFARYGILNLNNIDLFSHELLQW